MKLAFWNGGAPRVLRTNKRVRLPNGDVAFNATSDPAHDLYAYVETGSMPSPYEIAAGMAYANDGTTITAARSIAWRPLDEIKNRRVSELADLRYGVEVGGMVFAGNVFPTDDRSKTLIMGARTMAKEDAVYAKNWKVGPGQYVALDAVSLIAVADAQETHVAAAFANEETHAAAIMAFADAQAVVDYDITTGWPDNGQGGAA